MYNTKGLHRRAKKVVIFSFVILLISVPLVADETPAWLLLEKGILAFNERDFSTASHMFQEAKKLVDPLPEAEYWMGRLYEEEGEYILAEKQYERALDASAWLYIPSLIYEMKYRLSHIYLNTTRFEQYENILISMVDQEVRQTPEEIKKEHNYLSIFLEQGMDKLLYLYRYDCTFSYQAMTELGVYYYKTGMYSSSIVYNLYAIMNVFTTGINVLIEKNHFFEFPQDREHLEELDSAYIIDKVRKSLDPELRAPVFSTESERRDIVNKINQSYSGAKLDDFIYPTLYCLDQFYQDEIVRQYINDSSFLQALYYLGNALYAKGYISRAEDCWQLISDIDDSNRWKIMAEKQLVTPSILTNESVF